MGTNTVTNVTRVKKARDFMIGWYSYFVKGLFHRLAQLAYGYRRQSASTDFFVDNTRPLKLGAHKRVDRALTNLRGRRLKRKGKEVLGARETRGPGRTRKEGKKRRFLLSLLARPSRFSRA